MSKEEFKNLERGDIIQHIQNSSMHGVVTGNYGQHVTAVESFDITNPDEWFIVLKAGEK